MDYNAPLAPFAEMGLLPWHFIFWIGGSLCMSPEVTHTGGIINQTNSCSWVQQMSAFGIHSLEDTGVFEVTVIRRSTDRT